jgi:hypothetical protein
MKTVRNTTLFCTIISMILLAIGVFVYAEEQGINRESLHPMVKKSFPCPKLAFTTSSPLPSTCLFCDYRVQIQASGGVPPIKYYTIEPTASEFSTGCSYPARTSVPGLTLTCDGIIQGQPSNAGYYTIEIKVEDSCHGRQQPPIIKTFALKVEGPPQPTNFGTSGAAGSGMKSSPGEIRELTPIQIPRQK